MGCSTTHVVNPLCAEFMWGNKDILESSIISWYWVRWHRHLQSFLVEGKDSIILHNQYYGWWWPGDIKSQGINSHGISSLSLNIQVSALEGLTHWGLVMHKCVGKLTIIGSDNGLSPGRRQAILWTNDGILFIGPLGATFSEISIELQTFSSRPQCVKVPGCICNMVLHVLHFITLWQV